MRGIDASTFQNVIDWAAVKQSGQVDFAYARATDGPFYKDDTFARNHDVARLREIPFGAYHFFRFNSDAAVQARSFVQATQNRLGTLLPMIDVEEESFAEAVDVKTALAAIAIFVHGVIALTGVRTVIVYTNCDTWTRLLGNSDRFKDFPLWLAQTENPADGLFGGWTDWVLWQDSTTNVPGIEGAVDLDYLNPAHTLKDISR